MQLSKNFKLSEFTNNPHGIKIVPTERQKERVVLLCRGILQPTRDQFGPMIITSGLRNEKLRKKLVALGYPASPTSQHHHGDAADFIFKRNNCETIIEAYFWIMRSVPFNQLILYLNKDKDNRAIHVGNGDKKECLVYFQKKFYDISHFLEELYY